MPYDSMQGPLAGDEPKPGFFGGLLNALYPAGDYAGMIDPSMLRNEQNLALRHAGAMLLASSGPQPRGTRNVMGDIARALDPTEWQNRLATVAQQSATIGAMQRKAQMEAKAQQIMQQFPPRPGETDQQRDQRLSSLADTFQAAGMMDYAQHVSELRTSLRSPGLTEHNGQLIDHWGNVVGTVPGAEAGVEGTVLYNTSLGRLRQFDPIHKAVLILNQARAMPPVQGNKLDPTTSSTFLDAAKAILDTHTNITEGEESPAAVFAHSHEAGVLGKLIAALLSQGGSITTAQRDEVLRLVEPVVRTFNEQQTGVLSDIKRVFADRWSDNPKMAERMYNELPFYPEITTSGPASVGGTSQQRLRQLKHMAGVP